MQFKVYEVPLNGIHRIRLLEKQASSLCLRYDVLKADIPLESFSATESTYKSSQNNSELVVLFIQTSATKKGIDIKDVLKNEEGYQLIDTITCDSINYPVCKYSDQRLAVSILKKSGMMDTVPRNDSVSYIVYEENMEERGKLRKRYAHIPKVHILSKEEIGDHICNIIESDVFKAFGLKEKSETLSRYLTSQSGRKQNRNNIAGEDLFQGNEQQQLKHSIKRTRDPPKHIDDYCMTHFSSNIAGRRTEYKKMRTDDSLQVVGVSPFPSVSKEIDFDQKAERLRIEIMGLFKRSRVPTDEKPQCKDPFDDVISNALIKDLREASQSIQGCVLYNRSFLVFIDDGCDQDTLRSTVKRVLENHHFFFPVTFATSKEEFFSSCNVGSNIIAEFENGVRKKGTLGGFGRAFSDEGTTEIGVTARHVVIEPKGTKLLYAKTLTVSENNAKAEVLVNQRQTESDDVLDIAAASFRSCKNNLNTRYKTSEEKPATGILTTYSREEMQGLDVQMCGSTTPTGYGTITIPTIESVQDKKMKSYIIIEDRANLPQQEKKPFCAKGDSGAIVCADDQDNPESVHLISMVTGAFRDYPNVYPTTYLGDGIEQVAAEINSSIELL